MGRLALKFCIFVAINAPIIFYIEHRLAKLPTSYTIKRTMMDREARSADTLILGSSHALYGIAPDCLDGKALNLANVSQDLYYDCALAHEYLAEMPNLKRIIMSMSVFSFEYALGSSTEKWREDLYWHGFGVKPRRGKWGLSQLSLLAAYGNGEAIKALSDRSGMPNLDPHGWLVRPESAGGAVDSESGKIAVARHIAIMRPKRIEENIGRLEKLIRECQDRQIEVILVTLPAHRSYRDNLDKSALSRMHTAVERVCQDTHVVYLDFQADERFADSDFQDADHLDPAGARKFTSILNGAIQAH